MEEAKQLLKKFMKLPKIELSEQTRNELAGNALVLICTKKGEEIADQVFETLIPEEVNEKRLAFNLACWYAGQKDKPNLLKYAKTALELGFEAVRFKDDDFEHFKEDGDFIQLYSTSQFPDPRKDPQKWWDHLSEETRDAILWSKGADDDGNPDFEKIVKLTEIDDIRDVTTLDPLRYLTALKKLGISYSSFHSLEPLAELTALEELTIDGRHYIKNKKITDISPLANLKNLRRLSITNHEIRDVTPLKELTQLEELRLGINEITDISPLEGLTNLKDLSLRNNPIEDLSVVQNFKKLERLDIVVPGASDFGFFAGLKRLRSLWVGNAITTLAPFEDLPDLEYLYAAGKKISSEEAESFQKRHPKCDLSL